MYKENLGPKEAGTVTTYYTTSVTWLILCDVHLRDTYFITKIHYLRYLIEDILTLQTTERC